MSDFDFTPRATLFGRYAVAEPFRYHLVHKPVDRDALKTVEWTFPTPVLDQENLFKQNIDTSKLIPGAARVDALGSCTANATTSSYAERLGKPFLENDATAVDYEEWAIQFYHACTDQTGDPSQEWPPTDCGSTGLYCCTELQAQKRITSYETGSDVTQLLSLLQKGSVIQGTPFLNDWMQPDSEGFIDGDGSLDALEAAIQDGVAGGHETCIFAIEQLNLDDLTKTVLRVRNSWSEAWGLSGTFRMHASTLDFLCRYTQSVDFKQFVV